MLMHGKCYSRNLEGRDIYAPAVIMREEMPAVIMREEML